MSKAVFELELVRVHLGQDSMRCGAYRCGLSIPKEFIRGLSGRRQIARFEVYLSKESREQQAICSQEFVLMRKQPIPRVFETPRAYLCEYAREALVLLCCHVQISEWLPAE